MKKCCHLKIHRQCRRHVAFPRATFLNEGVQSYTGQYRSCNDVWPVSTSNTEHSKLRCAMGVKRTLAAKTLGKRECKILH